LKGQKAASVKIILWRFGKPAFQNTQHRQQLTCSTPRALSETMGRVISAAERACKLSAAKEVAYASAVTTYIESHTAYAELSDPHRKSPVSLHDLVSLHNGLINETTLS